MNLIDGTVHRRVRAHVPPSRPGGGWRGHAVDDAGVLCGGLDGVAGLDQAAANIARGDGKHGVVAGSGEITATTVWSICEARRAIMPARHTTLRADAPGRG